MGTLVPILEATRRNSKIRPSFTISLPSSSFVSSYDMLTQIPGRTIPDTPQESTMDHIGGDSSGHGTHSPLRCVNADNPDSHNSLNTESGIQLACREDDGDIPRNLSTTNTLDGHTSLNDTLTSSRHLAEVSSHIIASKFRIQTLHPLLPSDQGTITIKTSFLHIQPRKVIVHLPISEEDSGIDSESEDSISDNPPVFLESDISLDSLSSLEELRESNNTIRHTAEQPAISSTTTATTLTRTHISPTVTAEVPVVIHSKTPTWNEQHMIYQLDFGGRVTTKSAKNFQLEMGSEQVRKHS